MSGTNWTLPLITDTYVNYTAELMQRDVSAATQFNSGMTADSNIPTNAIQWNVTNSNWNIWNGTAWTALTATYGISISGNAATATTAGNATQLGGVAAASYLLSSAAASIYAPLLSPNFSGTPSLPTGATGITQTTGNNTTALATTAFVQATVKFVSIKRQVFSSSGTYTPSAGMLFCDVEAVGSGGGSGGCPATSSSQWGMTGAGSGGCYGVARLTALQIGGSQVVTIGAAGL